MPLRDHSDSEHANQYLLEWKLLVDLCPDKGDDAYNNHEPVDSIVEWWELRIADVVNLHVAAEVCYQEALQNDNNQVRVHQGYFEISFHYWVFSDVAQSHQNHNRNEEA